MVEELWKQQYGRLVNLKSVETESGCLIWQGQSRSYGATHYGIQNVRWLPGLEFRHPRKMYAHRVAYMTHHGTALPSNCDISHLCHNSLCVKVSHMSCDPHAINNNRQHCKKFGSCLGHQGFASCIL